MPMQFGDHYIPLRTLLLILALFVIALGAGLYLALAGGNGAGGGNGDAAGEDAGKDVPTITLPKAATETAEIETGQGAAGRIAGPKLNITASPTPQVQSGSWVVIVNIQGGKNRSQSLGRERLAPGKPFVVANNADGAYTVTPEILNCAKDCGKNARGYTLPPLTINPKTEVEVVIAPKCTKSPLPLGIDCARSQVLASYK